jgi:hypothetical protein
MRTDADRAAERVEDYENQFARNVAFIASRLRRLADAVEESGRQQANPNPFSNVPAASDAAAEIVQTLTWGFANLNLQQIVRTAAMLDANRAIAADFRRLPPGIAGCWDRIPGMETS